MVSGFWKDRRVFLTGHTGFKGGWLSIWLEALGAKVHGISLEPPTEPSLFEVANVEGVLASHTIGDIRDAETLGATMAAAEPEIVFHMAAQPLVRRSYAEPVETYSTNVMGTVNIFEAARCVESVRSIVNVTSDKCYENREQDHPFREDDAMGGYDPYSSSKGCAELVTQAYQRSFFGDGKLLASARAGNVIGGGDWAEDRLLPDMLRALDAGEPLTIRSPNAVRPWQHVLEPLSGYLLLAEALTSQGAEFACGWNFGPDEGDAWTVRRVVEYLMPGGDSVNLVNEKQPHEASLLRLDSTKARDKLGWKPVWSVEQALAATLDWHKAWRERGDMGDVCREQISRYGS
ncbi:MAG: CDP-glucose 4,6-dehydratase [Rhizobiaceae bacterium]